MPYIARRYLHAISSQHQPGFVLGFLSQVDVVIGTKGRSHAAASAAASAVLYLGPSRLLKENIDQQGDVKQPNLSVLLMFPRQQQGFSRGRWAERRYSEGRFVQEYKPCSDCIDEVF